MKMFFEIFRWDVPIFLAGAPVLLCNTGKQDQVRLETEHDNIKILDKDVRKIQIARNLEKSGQITAHLVIYGNRLQKFLAGNKVEIDVPQHGPKAEFSLDINELEFDQWTIRRKIEKEKE